MRYQLPQFIDVEDRVVGPLTIKQFGWLLGGVACCVPAYFLADPSLFITLSVIIIGTAGAFAFYKPYGRPLISYLISVVRYVFQPKIFLWKKQVKQLPQDKAKEEIKVSTPDFADIDQTQAVTEDRIKTLANKLDVLSKQT